MKIFYDETARKAFLEFLRNHTPMVLFLSIAVAVVNLTDWHNADIWTRLYNGFFALAWFTICLIAYVVNVWQFTLQTKPNDAQHFELIRAAILYGLLDGVAFTGVLVAAVLSVARLHRG